MILENMIVGDPLRTPLKMNWASSLSQTHTHTRTSICGWKDEMILFLFNFEAVPNG